MKQIMSVLVIEDHEDWREQLKEYLEEEGFHVQVADDLETGLEKLHHHVYSLITVDLQLDESTKVANNYEGWTILEEVIKQGKGRSIPTIVITGFDKDYKELKDIKKKYGTYHIFKKEFNRDEFIEKVKMATGYSELNYESE
ncbi:response regulator [candidate division KSB1 bacterium]|nr:response regulator [candidate division KSB1 bacterium]